MQQYQRTSQAEAEVEIKPALCNTLQVRVLPLPIDGGVAQPGRGTAAERHQTEAIARKLSDHPLQIEERRQRGSIQVQILSSALMRRWFKGRIAHITPDRLRLCWSNQRGGNGGVAQRCDAASLYRWVRYRLSKECPSVWQDVLSPEGGSIPRYSSSKPLFPTSGERGFSF